MRAGGPEATQTVWPGHRSQLSVSRFRGPGQRREKSMEVVKGDWCEDLQERGEDSWVPPNGGPEEILSDPFNL